MYRVGTGDAREEVLRRSKPFRKTSITELRISTNEQYVAYVLYSKLEAPIPLPDMKDEVFVRDLKSGKERKIADCRMTGNLIWSPDSSRLYFTVINGHTGIYRVNVRVLFRN